MSALRFRQVHLDFHTSEKIPGVGREFEARQFQEMLQRGHVNSVTLFSKCHHGMSYHDTAVGVRHPHMQQELLPQQIEACRAIDINTPIYISAGLDEAMALAHPEWTTKGQGGQAYDPLKAGWKRLCFNTPYLDYLCAQIDEVVERFGGGDGIFLDIIHAHKCYCRYCIEGMVEAGLDPTNDEDAEDYGYRVLQKYWEQTTAACKRKNPEQRVFHNSGHVPKGSHAFMKWNSHLELESLPTGGWGYDHFPLSAKYAATTGMDFLGMTGKFHGTWGEFGGFKRPNALRYECAAMLAFGSKCSVGDQLHPNGEMNRDTYELIGAAYKEVEVKETWCSGAVPVSEVALVSPEALHSDKPGSYRSQGKAEEGAGRMLLELQVQFDVVDLERDLSAYRLVILPDEISLEGDFATKMQNYVAGGGKVILSGRSGMDRQNTHFVLDAGLDIEGMGEYDPDYIVPGDMPTPLVRGRFVVHGGAWQVRPHAGTRVLAQRAVPYFNRGWDHFCSHQHTPDAEISEFPAITATDSIVYFAHNIFTAYRQMGQPLYRDLVQDAIHLLLGDLAVQTNLPTAARASLMHQADKSRYVLHLLYAVPVKRGADSGDHAAGALSVEIIEDLVPLHDIECSVRVPQEIKGVRLAPSGEEIEYSVRDGAVTFTVPKLLCHQMIELTV
ncbi:MAG TPA: beta-galactosidase trimerization domain-containing protein [Abditibacteriaceae bacterium]